MRDSFKSNIKVAARSRSYCNVKVPWSRSATLTFLCGAGTFLSCTYGHNAHHTWFLWEFRSPKWQQLHPDVTKNQTSTVPTTACHIVHFMWLTTPYKWMQSRDHKARRHLTRITLRNAPTSTLATSIPEHHHAWANIHYTVHTLHQSSAPTDSTRQTEETALQTYPPCFLQASMDSISCQKNPSLPMWWHNPPLYTALSSLSF